MKLYSIYDSVAELHGAPFFSENDGVALRSFRNAVRQREEWDREDFKLFHIGDFNEKLGILSSMPRKEVIIEDFGEKDGELIDA